MIRAPLCPSSGAQEYYTVVAECGISCCGFQDRKCPHRGTLPARSCEHINQRTWAAPTTLVVAREEVGALQHW